jgi:hypothetical protein
MNGAGCTPGDPAIQANRYFITAGSVNYKAGASGLVTLYCPIPTLQSCPGDVRVMRMTYTDSDGTGNAVSVTAQLLHLSQIDGAFLGVVPGAQISSNESSATVPTSRRTNAIEHAVDLNSYYYVRVDMNRAPGTSHVATFYGVNQFCLSPEAASGEAEGPGAVMSRPLLEGVTGSQEGLLVEQSSLELQADGQAVRGGHGE